MVSYIAVGKGTDRYGTETGLPRDQSSLHIFGQAPIPALSSHLEAVGGGREGSVACHFLVSVPCQCKRHLIDTRP